MFVLKTQRARVGVVRLVVVVVTAKAKPNRLVSSLSSRRVIDDEKNTLAFENPLRRWTRAFQRIAFRDQTRPHLAEKTPPNAIRAGNGWPSLAVMWPPAKPRH
jgi:hypothetical protein